MLILLFSFKFVFKVESLICSNQQIHYTSQAITSTGIKKGELFLADVSTQLKNKNITTDVKVDTNSNVSFKNAQLLLSSLSFPEMSPC